MAGFIEEKNDSELAMCQRASSSKLEKFLIPSSNTSIIYDVLTKASCSFILPSFQCKFYIFYPRQVFYHVTFEHCSLYLA